VMLTANSNPSRTLGLGRDVRHWHTTKARGDLSK
jgi:hypothetical protein